ncbi:glycosyltransferase family 39 protein [Candidatus Woesebacteria bacterium]|nr:glycosyltransferase family 39 protein [Candidatus Woesebacteria bacterium]
MHRLAITIIFLVAFFLLFHRLGANYLSNFDEAFYAVIAKEVVNSGNWTTFTFGHERFFAVSPFYLWLQAFLFKIFGPSELAVRFFAALSSFTTILSIVYYFLIKGKLKRGIVAALILLSTPKFLFLSRSGNLDATLTLFTTLSLLLFYAGLTSVRFLPLAGVASAFAFLSKGLFGLFPLATFLLYIVLFKRKLLFNKWLYFCLCIFLALILPWQMLQIARHGYSFINGFYGGYMVTKLGWQPFFSYFWWGSGLWQGMKLWFPLSLLAIFISFINKNLCNNNRFFIFSIFFYLFILSLIRTHNDWYLMPIYPILAILLGTTLVYFISRYHNFTFVIACLALACFQIVYYRNQFFVPQTTDAQVMMIKEAENLSVPGSPILLDDFYYPVAMYYSDRPIIRLRANRDPGAAISSSALDNYLAKGSLLLTNTTTADSAKRATKYPLILKKVHGELILFGLEKEP